LARRHFERAKERFEKAKERFEGAKGRFQKAKERFEKAWKRFEKAKERFQKAKERFERVWMYFVDTWYIILMVFAFDGEKIKSFSMNHFPSMGEWRTILFRIIQKNVPRIRELKQQPSI